jgi:hypothetical protein
MNKIQKWNAESAHDWRSKMIIAVHIAKKIVRPLSRLVRWASNSKSIQFDCGYLENQ